mmetsp:Transcript_12203/g.30712  ORF Transcript_12203/g.30712 Transcript_12203/m.30712 type:complete len:228 (+) Transcript_12203:299-982(+)
MAGARYRVKRERTECAPADDPECAAARRLREERAQAAQREVLVGRSGASPGGSGAPPVGTPEDGLLVSLQEFTREEDSIAECEERQQLGRCQVWLLHLERENARVACGGARRVRAVCLSHAQDRGHFAAFEVHPARVAIDPAGCRELLVRARERARKVPDGELTQVVARRDDRARARVAREHDVGSWLPDVHAAYLLEERRLDAVARELCEHERGVSILPRRHHAHP